MNKPVTLFTNFCYNTEIEDVAKLYFDVEKADCQQNADIVCLTKEVDGIFEATTTFKNFFDTQNVKLPLDKLQNIRLQKRFAKISIYNCLKKATGIEQAWGCLTGIRPTKLAYQLIEESGEFASTFENILGVSKGKINTVSEILLQQKGLLTTEENAVDLYVSIPFCLTRCSYCSFTSGEIRALKQFVEPYVTALCEEISQTLDFASKNSYHIKNIYIGGGTPTVLEVGQLKKILSTIDIWRNKNLSTEFTVEAGRPDTITKEKLALFNDFGVNRISINPQTFNQKILDLVGRKHTVEEIFEKFYLARQFGFDINMDLIAGLPTETYDEFCHSINCAVDLNAENITVHTLALKKGSMLKHQQQQASIKQDSLKAIESEKNDLAESILSAVPPSTNASANFSSEKEESAVSKMVEYSYNQLKNHGYLPYYMYRQKYMRQNLENVGFCKAGKACRYNIDNMEETTSILACGAGAISKRIFSKQNRIERSANAKDVKTYLENLKHFTDAKLSLF